MGIRALDTGQKNMQQILTMLQSYGVVGTVHVNTDINVIFTLPNYSDKAIRLFQNANTNAYPPTVQVGDYVSGTTLTATNTQPSTGTTSAYTSGTLIITANYVAIVTSTSTSFFAVVFTKLKNLDFMVLAWSGSTVHYSGTRSVNTTVNKLCYPVTLSAPIRDSVSGYFMTYRLYFIDANNNLEDYELNDSVVIIGRNSTTSIPYYELHGNDVVINGGGTELTTSNPAIIGSVLLKGAAVAFP